MRKSIFRHLYTWVLLAIVSGALLGYFYPSPPPLYLAADGAVIGATAALTGARVKSSDLPENILRAIQTQRPGQQINELKATPAPGVVYQITFHKKIGPALKPLGDGFIKLIRMVVTPIIFTTVVIGIAGMDSFKRVGRVG